MKTTDNQSKRKSKVRTLRIEAKPLTEEQITQFVEYFNQHSYLPGHKIPCTITGKLTTAVGPWLKKKVAEFGSIEAFLRGYVSREGKAAIKDPAAPPKKYTTRTKKVRTSKAEKEELIKISMDIPPMHYAPRRMLPTEFTEASKSICHRPDIFLTNGRHCEGCPNFDLCINELKSLPIDKKGKYTIKKVT